MPFCSNAAMKANHRDWPMISLGRLVGGATNGTETRVTSSGTKKGGPIHVR